MFTRAHETAYRVIIIIVLKQRQHKEKRVNNNNNNSTSHDCTSERACPVIVATVRVLLARVLVHTRTSRPSFAPPTKRRQLLT